MWPRSLGDLDVLLGQVSPWRCCGTASRLVARGEERAGTCHHVGLVAGEDAQPTRRSPSRTRCRNSAWGTGPRPCFLTTLTRTRLPTASGARPSMSLDCGGCPADGRVELQRAAPGWVVSGSPNMAADLLAGSELRRGRASMRSGSGCRQLEHRLAHLEACNADGLVSPPYGPSSSDERRPTTPTAVRSPPRFRTRAGSAEHVGDLEPFVAVVGCETSSVVMFTPGYERKAGAIEALRR